MNSYQKWELPVLELSTQDTLSISIHEISGDPGQVVYLQSSLHGAELQGTLVLQLLLEALLKQKLYGKVILVPAVNPRGMSSQCGPFTNGRHSPMSGDNWNRIFWDLAEPCGKPAQLNVLDFAKVHRLATESEICQQFKHAIANTLIQKLDNHEYGVSESQNLGLKLQLMASEADFILDLHTGSSACRYLYVPKHCVREAAYLRFPHNLIIPPVFQRAFDEATLMPWVHLQRAMKQEGREIPVMVESYTLELGSEERICEKEAKADCANILSYLRHKGIIKGTALKSPTSQWGCALDDFRSYYAKRGGLYEFPLKPGQHFRQGDILAQGWHHKDLPKPEVKSQVHAQKPGILISHASSANCQQGSELCLVMENPKPLESFFE